MQQQVSLEWLVEQARRGDQRAIASLYEFSYKEVYYTIHSVIADQDTALDITQDAFMKAFASLNTLGDPRKFTAWVKVIGRNLSLNYLKAKKPVLFSELTPAQADDDYELPFEDLSQGANPERVVDQQETTRLIQEILGTLSESQRMAVGLYYYQSMSVKEIAYQTGMSESSVKVHLHNGRKRIEEKVRELEKQGIKLYSLAPLPFLTMLFRSISMVFNPYMDPSAATLLSKLFPYVPKTPVQPVTQQPQNAQKPYGKAPQGMIQGSQVSAPVVQTAAKAAGKATAGGIKAISAGKIAAAKIAAIVAGSVLGIAAVAGATVAGIRAINGEGIFGSKESSVIESADWEASQEETSQREEYLPDEEKAETTEDMSEEQIEELSSLVQEESSEEETLPVAIPVVSEISGMDEFMSTLYSYASAGDYAAFCSLISAQITDINSEYHEICQNAVDALLEYDFRNVPPKYQSFWREQNANSCDIHVIYVPGDRTYGIWESYKFYTDEPVILRILTNGMDVEKGYFAWIDGDMYHEIILEDRYENGLAVSVIEGELQGNEIKNVVVQTASSLTRYVVRIESVDYWYDDANGEVSIEGAVDLPGLDLSFSGYGMPYSELAENLVDHTGYGHSYPMVDNVLDIAAMEQQGLLYLYGGEDYSTSDFLADEGVTFVIDYSSTVPILWTKVECQGNKYYNMEYVRQGSDGLYTDVGDVVRDITFPLYTMTDLWED